MSEELFDIQFAGQLLPGRDAGSVGDNLGKLFKASPETVAKLLAGGTHTLKRNADHATALKYQASMERAGAVAILKPVGGTPAPAAAPQIPVPSAVTTPAASALGIAPVGTAMLAEHERQQVAPVQVDTSHIRLASVFAAAEPERAPPPTPPDTTHISVAAPGADLLPDRVAVAPPPPPDTSAISLAAVGETLGQLHQDVPVSIPDISGISLAPVGAPLEELRPDVKPLNPDTSALKLVP